MTAKQISGLFAPDQSTYVTLTDGNGNLATISGLGGTVSSVSVVTLNGITGAVATPSTTPAITFTLGVISPTGITSPSYTVSSAGPSIFSGTGAPTTSAAQGSVFLRSDGSTISTRMYLNTTGVSTWTAVTTLA